MYIRRDDEDMFEIAQALIPQSENPTLVLLIYNTSRHCSSLSPCVVEYMFGGVGVRVVFPIVELCTACPASVWQPD